MAGITDKLRTLNNADLSKLAGRVDALRARLAKELKGQAANPADNLTVEQLLDALETARRRGL